MTPWLKVLPLVVGRLVLAVTLIVMAQSVAHAENPTYYIAQRVGSTYSDISNDLAVDANGNCYVTGRFKGTVDFDPGVGTANLTSYASGGTYQADIFIASYDAYGSYRWAFNVGGAPPSGMSSDNMGLSLAVDGSGNVVVCGLFLGTLDFNPGAGTATLIANSWTTFVAKYSSSGNFVWAFKIGPYSNACDVAIDANDNVIVAGSFSGTVDFNPGSGTASLTAAAGSGKDKNKTSLDMFVAKYTSTGSYVWAFKVGSYPSQDRATAVGVDASGNIYVTGTFGESASTVDFDPSTGTANLTGHAYVVAKYTSTGSYAWAFKLGAPAASNDADIAVGNDGSVAVSGGFSGTVDFDPGPGTALLTSSAASASMFISRYTASGAYQSAFAPAVGASEGIFIDEDGALYATGYYKGVNDFDPSSNSASLDTSMIGHGGFIARYAATGALDWALPLIDSGIARGRGIAATSDGRVYISGNLTGRVDFDPGSGTSLLTTAGNHDVFVARYDETIVPGTIRHIISSTDESGVHQGITAAPNPFSYGMMINVPSGSATTMIDVVDMAGTIIESHSVRGVPSMLIGTALPCGSYVLRVISDGTVQCIPVQKTP